MSTPSAPDSRSEPPRALAWLLLTVAIGALLLLASDLLALALHKNFALDEFQYAHAAYAIAHGQVPYRDFYDVHLPLNYQLLSLLFRLGAHKPSAILQLRLVMLGWALLTLFGSWLLCRRYGPLKALLGPLCMLLVVPLWLFGHELRHDPIALALLLLTFGLRELPVRPALSSALAGISCVLCFWSTQKAILFAGSIVVPALVLDLWHKRSGEQALLLAHPRAWLTGAGASAGLIVLWLLATHDVGPLVRWAFVWAEHYQSKYPRLSLTEQLLPQLDNFAILVPFALTGLWFTVRTATAEHASPAERRDLLLLGALGSTWLAYALNQLPFPYSAAPFWGLLGLLCARGVLELWTRPSAQAPAQRVVLAAALLALGFVVARCHALYRDRVAASNNTYQLGVLEQVETLTHEDDAFFDCAGNYVARPHSYFYFYIDAMMRHEIPNLSSEVQAALLASQTIGVMPDVRYGGLPPDLRAFVERHFQKYSGDLWLYGQSYDAHGNEPFLAIKRGHYFVSGAAGEVRVDGQTVRANDFVLERGPHQITIAGASGGTYVLWLPKNGEHWRPRPDARAAFSTVF